MVRLQSASYIHRYDPIVRADEQKRQRDWLVWFKPSDGEPAVVETKCENYRAKNMTLELVAKVEKGIPGCHVQFDNDWFFQAMLKDDACYMYSGLEMYDEITSQWDSLGLETHLIPNYDEQTGEEWTTKVALAPFTLIRERVTSLIEMPY